MKDGFIKIATGVFKISLGDCSANADKIIRMAADMSKKGVKLACFTELCVTGYTLEDVFSQKVLQESAEQAVERIAAGTAKYDILFAVGVPVTYGSGTYNCAAVICRGKLLALVPKTEIPNYNEFYEGRKFYSGKDVDTVVKYAGFTVPLTAKAVFKCESVSDLTVGFELCEDLWVASPPSIKLAQNGANVIFNLSCSNEIIGKSEYRRSLVMGQSGRLICAYASASAGMGESTSDLVFSGHCVIAENGRVMSEQRWENDKFIEADIDVQRLCSERRRMTGFRDAQSEKHTVIGFELNTEKTQVNRNISPTPFVPQDSAELTARCEEILRIQSAGLKQRLSAIGCKCAVLGLSGGLDSTLALLVTARAFDELELDKNNIIAVTMPCFGTTGRTFNNSVKLAGSVGVRLMEIDIKNSVLNHFEDIGQDENTHDVTYENAQARERTQVLMDIANKNSGIVIGTGDLSETALGWSTYNGDHMSMYGVNCGVPKTLLRHIVAHCASISDESLCAVLEDILDTPVSPELLPPKDGVIAQKTENIVGPYELHDFFLYYFVRFGFTPEKIYRLAGLAFGGRYSGSEIKKWLIVFIRRFFAQQFKRNCVPDGPKVGSVSLSPRGDWRMPSDAISKQWLERAQGIIVE